MTNHLAQESSPYLLQHAENPVDWFPWGESALEKARTEDKPIFLSIGYAACHWCHVMAHESFEDPTTAALMNEICVNIKVDREERPDLDSIYMNAVVALTGQGGWPMSVFLTPEGIPFFGGTYFPPQPRYGRPSFKDVLAAIGRAWQNDRQGLLESGQELLKHIQSGYHSIPLNQNDGQALSEYELNQAADRLAQSYDWEFGGWGKAPKFPQPMAIELLLQRASRGDKQSLSIARHALDAMAKGGMYDVVGGGFARYSTDNYWLAPHFEKMLYDNAQLARAYLHAYLLTEDNYYLEVCTRTLDFTQRELGRQDAAGEGQISGGFFSSLDADSEGEEGKYYCWQPGEIQAIFANTPGIQPADLDLFQSAFGLPNQGNFEGKLILQRTLSNQALAEKFAVAEAAVGARLDRLLQGLARARAERIRPATDDKVLTAWNALTLVAFAEAARYLKRPDYLEIARATANFLLNELFIDGTLYRSWRNGRAQHIGYLEDYAGLILGLLALYQSDPDPRWYSTAERLAEELQTHFPDAQGGFFDTRHEQKQLIVRPKDIQDNATPSGNALAALALLQLSHYNGNWKWRQQAEGMLAGILPTASRYPTTFAMWLSALDFALAPVQEVAILGDQASQEMQALVSLLWNSYQPERLAAISSYPPASNAPALLQDRDLLNGQPTAYVCRNFTCQLPVNTLQDFARQLEN